MTLQDGVRPIYIRQCPEYVAFTTPDEVQLPVPSPVYLAIHVALMSGATKCIERLNRDMEDSPRPE
jgi:hypothetical protein